MTSAAEIFAQQIKPYGLYAAFASYREKGKPSQPLALLQHPRVEM
jgi:hypothetical protein